MGRAYMRDEDFVAIAAARSHRDLCQVAIRVLGRMPKPVIQVCGPISTGGLGSPELNMARLDRAIVKLTGEGFNIFNQMPFEPRIKEFYAPGEDGYDWRILTDFYQPLFELRLIQELFFLPGFTSSTGAMWEHDQALRLGMKIVYLDDDLRIAA